MTGDALPRLADDGDDPAIGETPPTLQGYSFDGTPITIGPDSGDGKATMVVFLAHWCPHCNREVPRLVQWYEKDGGVPDDLNIVGVSTGTSDTGPELAALGVDPEGEVAVAGHGRRRGADGGPGVRPARLSVLRHHRRRRHGEGPPVGRDRDHRPRADHHRRPRLLTPDP